MHDLRDILRLNAAPTVGLRHASAAFALLGVLSHASGSAVESETTTIYVGRHFEVREHNQPTKYVFNGSTRVAGITGSISPNPRVQRIPLYPGWNLCSAGVSGPLPASGAEAISAAYQWNTAAGDYSPVAAGQSLTAGMVLWVKARTNAVLSVLGSYADPVTLQAQPGGTYLAGSGLEAWSPPLPDSASMWEFDAIKGQWSEHLTSGLTAVSSPSLSLCPGQAFYLETAAPTVLEVPPPQLRVRYYHPDHLGSSTAITDADGALVDETSFYPFGAPRNDYRPRPLEEPYRFTQKELDCESRLQYFEARYLAGSLARFVASDLKYACPDRLADSELGALVSAPQMLNLYAYVRNNPLKFTDPSGEDTVKPKNQAAPPAPEPSFDVTLTLDAGGSEISIPLSSAALQTDKRNTRVASEIGAEKTKATLHEIVITKDQDASSAVLFNMSVAGTVALSGEVTFRRRVNGHSEIYMKYKLTSVVISGYQTAGQTHATESLNLNAANIEAVYSQKPAATGEGAGEPAVLRHRYTIPEAAPLPAFKGYDGPEQYMFSTGRPAERQAAESCGACTFYPP